jgi:hypothetical protein
MECAVRPCGMISQTVPCRKVLVGDLHDTRCTRVSVCSSSVLNPCPCCPSPASLTSTPGQAVRALH